MCHDAYIPRTNQPGYYSSQRVQVFFRQKNQLQVVVQLQTTNTSLKNILPEWPFHRCADGEKKQWNNTKIWTKYLKKFVRSADLVCSIVKSGGPGMATDAGSSLVSLKIVRVRFVFQ